MMREFNLLLPGIFDKDKSGHLFIADIEFDEENLYCNFLKKKTVSPDVRPVFQLLDVMILNDKGTLNSYNTTTKTYSTMEKKIFIPLYAEYLNFLITRCSWKRTISHDYYTFEQSKFEKHFAIMNQLARENAKSSVEKEFYKLMNNSNFCYDCRNNAKNYSFKPIFDKLKELSYIKIFSMQTFKILFLLDF